MKGKARFGKRRLDHQVIDRTMKAAGIELVGFPMIQWQMRIVVMRYQVMDQDLRRNSKCEQRQQSPG